MAPSFPSLRRPDPLRVASASFAAAAALPLPVGSREFPLPMPRPVTLPWPSRRRVALAAILAGFVVLAVAAAPAASRLASHVRWDLGPSLPQRYAELEDGSRIGLGSGVTPAFEIASGSYELAFRAWNEDGCRLQVTILAADGALAPTLDTIVAGRKRGALQLGAIPGGTTRFDVRSSCLWALRMVPSPTVATAG